MYCRGCCVLFFKEAFRPRQVNNIYFDTPAFDSYYDHLNERNERKKFRLRWYDNLKLENNPSINFEIKNKIGDIGSKIVTKIPLIGENLILNRKHKNKIFQEFIAQQQKVNQVLIPKLNIVLYNRYQRNYFYSKIAPLRLTIDHQMTYGNIIEGKMIQSKFLKNDFLIMELKYNTNVDIIDEIDFPYYPTRFSKYIHCLSHLLPHLKI